MSRKIREVEPPAKCEAGEVEMEYIEISDRIGYLAHPVNIGVVKDGPRSAIIIDTGLDETTGKKILAKLSDIGLQITAVINTHSHADHIGGNRFLQEATGAAVYAPVIESAMIEETMFEPFYLFSGAAPPRDLTTRVLKAEPSRVDHVIGKNEGMLVFDEVELKVIPLAGHSMNHLGYIADGVFFTGDTFFSGDILEKYRIPFHSDIVEARASLRKLREIDARYYIPSHGDSVNSADSAIEANQTRMDEAEAYLRKLLAGREKTTEEIIPAICAHFRMVVEDIPRYHLMRTSVMAYLSMLRNSGVIDLFVKDNQLIWKG